MKVGIIGSGGREHALCYAIKKSKKVMLGGVGNKIVKISDTSHL